MSLAAASHLADTNILLRISQRHDPQYSAIRAALLALRGAGSRLCFTSQNLAEFWNVCTRPVDRNGYGLSVAETDRRAQLIESSFFLLPDIKQVHFEWRKLVVAHSVSGIQVHDARLVASMQVHAVTHILTLNEQDFRRFTGIVVVHPEDLKIQF